MRALTVIPRQPGSAQLDDVPEPDRADGDLLTETIAIGICGTDREILSGAYGSAPAGRERLTIGHESLGRVVEAPRGCGFAAGDLIAGVVRRPDPVPCSSCAAGEWDMCRNGRYTERGIKGRDGYASERFRVEPGFAIKVAASLGHLGVLLEPASVVAKAWDHVERIGRRSAAWKPACALITGAGPIGLLAALLGRQRGLDVHVFDRATTGTKPKLVADLPGQYHSGDLAALKVEPDIVIECTGSAEVIAGLVTRSTASRIMCLAGLSSGHHEIPLDLARLDRSMVLENDVIVGVVNANLAHYRAAADALARADQAWLSRMITRRVPVDEWPQAFQQQPDDIKVVIDFAARP
jgi:threonine dehydrogenase-like Zn-dependent dehydrogenase